MARLLVIIARFDKKRTFFCVPKIHPTNIGCLGESGLTKCRTNYMMCGKQRIIAAMADLFQPLDAQRFKRALARFDEENSGDPNHEIVDGKQQPRELVYAQWLTDWVLRLRPDASEELRLAARCQHLRRWEVPRNSYPMTRVGYLQWREGLKKFHAQKAGEILKDVGYSEEVVSRVQSLNLKKDFPKDPETRVLEDALCLLFLEKQFADLAAKTAEDKIINAVQKTWKKMTEQARAKALELSFGEKEKKLIQQALMAG
jgi:hypothetical protein